MLGNTAPDWAATSQQQLYMEVQHKFWWVEASLHHLSIFPFLMEDPILHMVVSLSKANLVRILPRDAVFN